MGLFRRRQSTLLAADKTGGKLYKMIYNAAITGLFVAAALVTLCIVAVLHFSANLVAFICVLAIICLGCLIALPWIRELEKQQNVKLSWIFLGLVVLCCLLWIICVFIITSIYKQARDGEVSNLIPKLKFLKVVLVISMQFIFASTITKNIMRYKKSMIPFQAITYASMLYLDVWISVLLFSFGIKNRAFHVNEVGVGFCLSKLGYTLLALSIVFTILSALVMNSIESKRVRDVIDAVQPTREAQEPERKLAKLKEMFENNLITKEEYEQKKSEVLKDM